MRIHMAEAWKKCPKYGKIEYQVKAGRNSSGANAASVRSAAYITPNAMSTQKKPKNWQSKYTTGGVSGQGVGKILGMNKSTRSLQVRLRSFTTRDEVSRQRSRVEIYSLHYAYPREK